MRKFHVREGQNGHDQMRLMYFKYHADSVTERERQLKTARAD